MRPVRTRPGGSATVIATVAVAIGVTTAVYSVVHGVLLKPLPFPEPQRLAQVWQTKERLRASSSPHIRALAERLPLAFPRFKDWTEEDTGFEALGAWTIRAFVHRQADGAEILWGTMATSGYFRALGVGPVLGRTLQPEDDAPGAPRVVVLSHTLWVERFGSGASALGQDLLLDGIPHTVVGVMPAGFQLPGWTTVLWTPLSQETTGGLSVVGRLAPGVDLEVAAGRLAVIQKHLDEAYPDAQSDLGSRIEPLLDEVVGGVRSTLWFLLGAVGLVLVIAVVNIANLLSVSGLTRRKELAVKAALGASARRLVRGLLAESAVLAGMGGLLGIVVAWLSLPLLLRMVPPTVPRYDDIGMDVGVLAFGLAVTGLTAVLVGVLPAWQAARAQPREVLSASGRAMSGGRMGARVRALLVVTEVALALVLLVGARLLGESFLRLWTVERGFATEGLISLSVDPDPVAYPEQDDRVRFLSMLRERLDAIPGAEVTATNQVPLSGEISSSRYQVERAETEPEDAAFVTCSVLENYFDVMGIPVVAGRSFDASDIRGAPLVAMVNEAAAGALWHGESPVGKRIRHDSGAPWISVIGVARNVRHEALAREPESKLYLPAWQSDRYPDEWALRARGNLESVADQARKAVAAVSPTTPVRRPQVLEETIARSVAVPRFRAFFVVGLAALAGVLALLGVYGVVTFAVAQRTREIGVRLALGARASRVVVGVVAGGLKLVLAGIAVGLAVAWATNSLVRGFLFGVQSTDPLTYVVMSSAVALVAAAAAWLPARRAAAVDPASVLNSE